MAKHYINFDEKVYGIDEANLAPATNSLIAHLETLKGGESGAGTLELGKEYKFKEVITEADFQTFFDNAVAEPDNPTLESTERRVFVGSIDGEDIGLIAEPVGETGFSLLYTRLNPSAGAFAMYVYAHKCTEVSISMVNATGLNEDGWYAYDVMTKSATKTTAPTTIIPTNAEIPSGLDVAAVFFDIGGGNNEVTETVTADSEFSHVSIENCYRIDCSIADIDPETFDGRIDNHYKVDITFNDGTAAKSFYLDGEGMTESGLVLMPAEGPLAISNGTDIYAYVVEGNLEEVVGAEGYEFLKDIFPPNTILIPQSAFTNLHVETFSITYTTGEGGNEGDLDITLDGAVYKVDSTKLAPATNSLIAHLETLKGGDEGGGLVAGETYTLKNNLNDINPADFMKAPLVEGAYTIFRYDPSVSAGLGFVTAELLASFGANVASDGWMVTTPDIENIYYYPLKMVDDASGEMVDNYVGWLTIPGHNVAPEISITIPSSFDETFAGYSLDELAVFFDIPSAGGSGTLEYGKEYTFKDVITREDCEKYIANAEPHVTHSDRGENWYCIYSDTSDGTGEHTVMLVHYYLEGTFVIYYNDSEKIFGIDAGATWLTMNFSTGAPVPEPTDPPTMPITDGGLMSADLVTTAIFFDIPGGGNTGNDGDTKIVINGAEYWVDSAKLADAKSALAAHLEALEDASIPEESKYQLTIERNGIIYHWDVDSPSKLWLNLNGKYDTTNTYYINCPYASSYVCLASSAAIVGGVENSASIVQYGDNAYSVEEIYYTVAQQQGDSN